MFENTLEDKGREVQRRLYAHHDYFGNIIPSSWFLLGSLTGAFVFYRHELGVAFLRLKAFLQPLGEPSTGVEVVMAIMLAIAAFNVVYVVGQLLNGVAAVLLDRVIVKKLLQYPFTLYEMKWNNRDANLPDGQLFRDAVTKASYAVFCVNLAPVVFFELALVAFGRVNPHAGSWVQRHPTGTVFLSLVLVMVHFGIPSVRKARQVCGEGIETQTMRLELIWGHVTLIVISTAIVSIAISARGQTESILLLPLANVAMAIADRKLLLKYGAGYRSNEMRHVFVYARRTFFNPAYFAAKLVGYGTTPAAELLGKAIAEAKYDSRANDFYWMCQLRLENDAPRSYDTAYHGMAMYTMNRNLANATAFVTIASLVAFYAKWPNGIRYLALAWVGILCVLCYIFFVRYLYLFSGLYSKYVVRTAAFLADRQKPHVISP